jgi:hypothetical protein
LSEFSRSFPEFSGFPRSLFRFRVVVI